MFCLKPPDRPDSEEGPADAGEQAAENHVAVPGPQHIDADGVGGGRVLADRSDPQSPPGMEQGYLDTTMAT